MPYYWSRVWEIYTDAFLVDSNTPGIIINDLAWLFLEQGDTPESLYLDYNACRYREPCSDEQCDLKTWYDEIMSSGNYQGNNLLKLLFKTNTLTELEASNILHSAPCHVINKFMNTMEEEFGYIGLEYTDLEYDIRTFERDGRQSPYASDNEMSDDEMPPLVSDEIPELHLEFLGETETELVSTDSDYSTDYTTDDYTTDDSTDYEPH
jgi:hypothetical protein